MSESDEDKEVRDLVEAIIRTLIYVVRWLARRYHLEHLTKWHKWPR